MTNPPIKPTFAENLTEAAAIKAQMLQLLAELEQTATGHPIEKPGAWRHHPVEWANTHLSLSENDPPTQPR